MVNNMKGAVSLAYLRGEKTLRPRKLKKVKMEDLTREQELKAEEMARNSGRTFHECAAEVLEGQKTLDGYNEKGKRF